MLRLEEVNELRSQKDFERHLGCLLEHSNVVLGALWFKRPFKSVDDLVHNLWTIIDELPQSVQCSLLGQYPDLASHLSILSADSRSEQASAGVLQLPNEEHQVLNELNLRYRKKFGFPFVTCARLSNFDLILNAIKMRFNNTREQEMRIGLAQVKKICDLRAKRLLAEERAKL